MLDDINLAAFEIDDREHICSECNTVHWTPAGRVFCGTDD
ncbi:hypothetical protein SEA_BAILEYBLU_40 [Arthrobacter phage BaileyBlu]|uniref:Uncharacterized protein n=1 Tax=Arthrobacter phage BaileyBlu TaxID=2910754 RepID=A0AA49GZT7_9CAUD|nr:hypothetical protein PQD78_gp40 [Arthrobacter phage BaileyBlu]UJQ87178.1 hypothetical protein SEA_BAILEYBLU_40 [Arthrobacter phage BaileyBlu]